MRARRLRVWVVGSLGLALPLALTALGYRATRASLERSRAAHFEEAARGTTRALEERLAAYEAALVSARALLVARPDVDRRAWAAFVAQLDVPHRLPGLRALGYVVPVSAERLADLESAARRDGAPEFAVHPRAERPEFFATLLVEPHQGNQEAIGFDIGSEPERRAAAERARDSGSEAATGRTALVQDPERRPSFILYLPVYAAGADVTTVESRRGALRGWVYGAFRVTDIAAGLPGERSLDLAIYEGAVAPERLLHGRDGSAGDPGSAPAGAVEARLAVGGRHWIVRIAPRGEDAAISHEPLLVLAGGGLVSLLLLGLVLSLMATETRARTRAEELTREGRASAEALAAVSDRLKAVLDAATQVAIVATDIDGTITVFTPGAERLLGYSAAEIVGRRTPLVFYLAAELEAFARSLSAELGRELHGFEALTARAREGQDARRECTFLRKEGERRQVSAEVTALRDERGAITGFLLIASDVTEQRRIERRQAIQHAAARALAESMLLEQALPRLLEEIGKALGWVVGFFWLVEPLTGRLRAAASWSSLPDDFGALLSATEEAQLQRNEGRVGEVWDSGQPRWDPDVQLAADDTRQPALVGLHGALAAPVRLGGDVYGVIELLSRRVERPEPELLETLLAIGGQVAQFIERDAADRAVRASDERLRAISDNMLEGLVVVDERATIESVNPAAEQIFGYPSSELVGQPLRLLLPMSLLPIADGFLKDARQRAMGRVTEWEGRRKNGDVFPFELSLFEFRTPEGRRFAGHVRDVSQRRELERMKREFVATVSHELRTPLTSIRGSLGLLSAGAVGELPDEAKDVVAIAERNTLRLIRLINDILDLERLESGKLELHVAPVEAALVLERATEAARGTAEAAEVEIQVSRAEGCALADTDRLVQVVVNLLSNAVKFSARGSAVLASARPLPGCVEFRVTDRGRGIPASHQRLIFERFQQVRSSDARQQGGTGLGLAICRAIVERHGGTIGVESELGTGSSFWFRIPEATTVSPETGADPLLSAMRLETHDPGGDVLLVDPDEALLGIQMRQLLSRGIATRTATDVREAMHELISHPPALVVLEPDLPGGGGRPLVEAMRRDERLSTIPLLVYTGRDLSVDEAELLRLSETRYLTKSRASETEFLDTVRQLLEAPRSSQLT